MCVGDAKGISRMVFVCLLAGNHDKKKDTNIFFFVKYLCFYSNLGLPWTSKTCLGKTPTFTQVFYGVGVLTVFRPASNFRLRRSLFLFCLTRFFLSVKKSVWKYSSGFVIRSTDVARRMFKNNTVIWLFLL